MANRSRFDGDGVLGGKDGRRRGPLALSLSRANLAVYTTGHGLGHAARVALVLEEIAARAPDLTIHVRGRLPRFLLPPDLHFRHDEREVDFGVRQPDALGVDHAATLADLGALAEAFPDRVRAEAAWLHEIGAALVLGDVPPLAFAAAAHAGLPSVALANFSWDWIYRELAKERPEYERFADLAASAYASAAVCCRLPLHADLGAFPRIEDVPLVVRRAAESRAEAKRAFAIPTDRPAVLLSFGGFPFPPAAQERLARSSGVALVVTDPPSTGAPGVLVARPGARFATLLRAVDAVVTKPGWGLFAGCLANGARILHASRDGFPEARVLAEAVRRDATARQVDAEKILAGEIADELGALLARPVRDDPPATDGAAVVAARVLGMLAEARS